MRVRTVLVALVGAAYVAGCHWLMTSAPASRWNAVVVIGPMLGLLALFAARRGPRLVAGAALARPRRRSCCRPGAAAAWPPRPST